MDGKAGSRCNPAFPPEGMFFVTGGKPPCVEVFVGMPPPREVKDGAILSPSTKHNRAQDKPAATKQELRVGAAPRRNTVQTAYRRRSSSRASRGKKPRRRRVRLVAAEQPQRVSSGRRQRRPIKPVVAKTELPEVPARKPRLLTLGDRRRRISAPVRMKPDHTVMVHAIGLESSEAWVPLLPQPHQPPRPSTSGGIVVPPVAASSGPRSAPSPTFTDDLARRPASAAAAVQRTPVKPVRRLATGEPMEVKATSMTTRCPSATPIRPPLIVDRGAHLSTAMSGEAVQPFTSLADPGNPSGATVLQPSTLQLGDMVDARVSRPPVGQTPPAAKLSNQLRVKGVPKLNLKRPLQVSDGHLLAPTLDKASPELVPTVVPKLRLVGSPESPLKTPPQLSTRSPSNSPTTAHTDGCNDKPYGFADAAGGATSPASPATGLQFLGSGVWRPEAPVDDTVLNVGRFPHHAPLPPTSPMAQLAVSPTARAGAWTLGSPEHALPRSSPTAAGFGSWAAASTLAEEADTLRQLARDALSHGGVVVRGRRRRGTRPSASSRRASKRSARKPTGMGPDDE